MILSTRTNTVKLLVGLLLLVFLGFGGLVLAEDQVPAQANPAQVINQAMRNSWFQSKVNLWGPITEEDYMPKNDAVIEFHNMDVDAQILKDYPQTNDATVPPVVVGQ